MQSSRSVQKSHVFRSVRNLMFFQICQKKIHVFRSARNLKFQSPQKSYISDLSEISCFRPAGNLRFQPIENKGQNQNRRWNSAVLVQMMMRDHSPPLWLRISPRNVLQLHTESFELRSKSRSEKKSEWGNKGAALNILRNQGPITLACDVSCMLLDFKVYAPPFLDHYYARGTFFSQDICIKLLQPAKTEKREKNSHILLH